VVVLTLAAMKMATTRSTWPYLLSAARSRLRNGSSFLGTLCERMHGIVSYSLICCVLFSGPLLIVIAFRTTTRSLAQVVTLEV